MSRFITFPLNRHSECRGVARSLVREVLTNKLCWESWTNGPLWLLVGAGEQGVPSLAKLKLNLVSLFSIRHLKYTLKFKQ